MLNIFISDTNPLPPCNHVLLDSNASIREVMRGGIQSIVSPHNALFTDLSWFILFGYVLVHVCVVGYLDVLSEVHISMFFRWMYILVRPCHKYFLYSMCTIVGAIPIHFIVNCIACVRVL